MGRLYTPLMRFTWVLLLLLSTFAAPAFGSEIVFVQNTYSGDITLIDAITHKVLSTINIGKYPDDVTASPDNATIYVNRIDSAGLKGALNVGDTGEVIALDPATEKVRWRVPVNGMPHHMTVTRDGKFIFVPLYNGPWTAVIDTEKHAVVDRIGTGFGSHGTRLSPDGKRLYVGSMMNHQIAVVDVATHEVIKRIPFDDGIRPFEMTRDEKWLFAQISRLHGFEVVDLTLGKVVKTVPLPALPAGTKLPEFYPRTYNHGLAISHNEKYLFAAGSVVNYVAVYSLPDLTLVKTIPVGTDPNWIAFNHDDEFAYVTNRGSDNLSVISVKDLKEVARLPVGTYPQRVICINVEGRAR